MIYPSLDELLKHADNKFTLIIIAAKRARQIIEKSPADDEFSLNAVTTAFEEIANGKTKFESTKAGIRYKMIERIASTRAMLSPAIARLPA